MKTLSLLLAGTLAGAGLLTAHAATAQTTPFGSQSDPVGEPGVEPVSGPVQTSAQTAHDSDIIGDDFYCRERKLGTHFYCDKRRRKPAEATAPPPPVSYAAQLKELQAKIEESRARAVLAPTPENITAYITVQREQLDRSSFFADMWQRAIWQNPALDYTLQRPVSTLGKRLWSDQRSNDREQLLSGLSKRYGLYYFFAQSCAACDVAGPIVKGFGKSYNMSVLAVSMDGGPTKSFPDYVVNNGQHARLGLTSKATPALVLYDTVTHEAVPVGYGIMPSDEIATRIFSLVQLKPGSDF